MSFEEGALDSYTFDDIMECDKNPSTKGGYTNLIKHFVQFLRRLHPHLLGEKDEIDLPNVTIEVLKAFIDHVKYKRKDVKRVGIFSERVDPVNDKYVLNSANYISSYRSALKWHYNQNKVDYPSEFNADMSRFADGFKRIKAGRKDCGDEAAEEGKSPMQFTGYEWLATKAMKATFDFKAAMFSWTFLLLAWNLISRGKNVGKLNFEQKRLARLGLAHAQDPRV